MNSPSVGCGVSAASPGLCGMSVKLYVELGRFVAGGELVVGIVEVVIKGEVLGVVD